MSTSAPSNWSSDTNPCGGDLEPIGTPIATSLPVRGSVTPPSSEVASVPPCVPRQPLGLVAYWLGLLDPVVGQVVESNCSWLPAPWQSQVTRKSV